MEQNQKSNRRLYLLAGFLALVLLAYGSVLYDTQVNDHDYYLAQSVRTIARSERVEASRGIITDRNGKALVSNRSSYNLTFDSTLLKDEDDENRAILRLLELCRDENVTWVDNLPLSPTAPFTYTLESVSALQRGRFLTYLKSLGGAEDLLEAYLLQHPETLQTVDADGNPVDLAAPILADAELTEREQGEALLEAFPAENLTGQLLIDAGISAHQLVERMRADMDLPPIFSLNQARMVLGVRYELALRRLDNYDAYVMAEDIDTAFISLLSDGSFAGAKVTSSSVREYRTSLAAHILGTVGRISDMSEVADLPGDYSMDDWIGKDGAEAAFEEYLKGTDGRRTVYTNADGKVTSELYTTEPQPGNTVELTIDLDLQTAVETALSETVGRMTEADGVVRSAAAVVTAVGTGETLALASYPTFDLATYRQNFTALNTDPARPLVNRATQGTYPPGSTLKPLTAIAALQSGNVTLTERIRDTGRWTYPGDANSYAYCWNRGGHGRLNVTEAITVSCNYFFAEMGYRMGMDTFTQYLSAFGLGQHTGIEIGDYAGTLPSNRQGENQTPWAAFGQANQLYTPIQMSNYVATLVSGGKHCQAHLLKAVKSYDNTQVVAVGDNTPTNTVEISDAFLESAKAGMLGLTTTGSLSGYFRNCVVQAGAKTGTAQLGANLENNGVFVCFAPYDDPEIALAIVIEKGGSGSALASTAVNILNAYFSAEEVGSVILGEHQLLQ